MDRFKDVWRRGRKFNRPTWKKKVVYDTQAQGQFCEGVSGYFLSEWGREEAIGGGMRGDIREKGLIISPRGNRRFQTCSSKTKEKTNHASIF